MSFISYFICFIFCFVIYITSLQCILNVFSLILGCHLMLCLLVWWNILDLQWVVFHVLFMFLHFYFVIFVLCSFTNIFRFSSLCFTYMLYYFIKLLSFYSKVMAYFMFYLLFILRLLRVTYCYILNQFFRYFCV